jgi:cephalosporin-C deacetylase-like acetyl esterase
MNIKSVLRFSFFQVILFTGLLWPGIWLISAQEENLEVLNRWIEWSGSGHMLNHHLNSQAFSLLDKRDQEVGALRTREDWKARQEKVRTILMDIVGPFPEKTPLNSRVTGTLKKDGYRIEKILYESVPGFYVTGGLYIPDGAPRRKPAILFLSGHTENGFRARSYQVMILNLVKKGFIVFAIDPISQGERIQLYDPATNASFIGPTTREHSYLGHQCFISGKSLARYFIWDGIRGIDYLLTRREVDPEKIGITGQSGGGTQTSYIFAFDDRIKAAASVNYITGFRRLLESIGPQDAEQNLYHGILNGITHADLLAVRAPDPSLIVSGTYDFFSIQGARETYAEVKNAYAAFGMENNIGMVEDDWGHGYTVKIRESVSEFFQKSLNLPGDPGDEDVTVTDPEDLFVTKTGNVASSFENMETVSSLNKKESQYLMSEIGSSRGNMEKHLGEVNLMARKLSGYIEPPENINSVFRGRYQRDGYSVEMYALHGEGNYIIPLLLFIPGTVSKSPAIIYLHPEGKITDALPGGKIEQLVRKGFIVAAPDVIGTGEVRNNSLNGNNFLALMIGRSVLGIQAGDVSRVVSFLRNLPGVDHERIGAVAFGEMGPVLLHAASFNTSIRSVTLAGSLISYQAVVMNERYDPGFLNNYVAGALTAYDLPDLIANLAPRKVAIAGSRDQLKHTASPEKVEKELEFPLMVYSKRNMPEKIKLIRSADDLNSLIEWAFQ